MRTLTEKQKMSQEEAEKKRNVEAKLRALWDPYDGKTDGLKVITPKDSLVNAGWNEHHLFPITKEDPVYVHPDQSDLKDGYIRVIYYDGTFVAVLTASDFDGI